MTIPCKSPSTALTGAGARARPVDMLVWTRRFCQCVFTASLALAALFFLAALPAKCDPNAGPFASGWSEQAGGAARMRLIATAPLHGVYHTAVEIKLVPRAITYWRLPGEAGVPPEFFFDGSDNIASTQVFYPAPSRIDEEGIEAFGYRGGVIFPIEVTAVDASKPVRLTLSLDYAVCDRICVPVKGHAELLLPQSGESPLGAMIAAAEARVPSPLSAREVAEKVTIGREPDQGKPRWSLVWHGAMPAADLFAEGPQGWAFETHKATKDGFSLVAVEMPATVTAASVPVRLTLTGPDKAYQFTVPLPVAGAAR